MKIEAGKNFEIRVNYVSSYTITLTDGSKIRGLITPNNALTGKSEGSIISIDVEVLDPKETEKEF